jgi:4-hydroxybenzoate polyprenyltransferase
MRLERPIGTYLLLWPTLWALWIAASGMPHWHYLVIFTLGTVLMRSAGCVINDFADRNIDGKVERTKARPIPAGDVTAGEAIQLFLLLIVCAFILVLNLDWPTVALSVVGLLLAFSYPFMKRYTHFPQVVLGAAYSWSIPMAYMAVMGDLPPDVWLIYFANLCWTVSYDTYYAMVDRDDDLKIGVKSTAIAFGDRDLLAIAVLQGLTLFFLSRAGVYLGWHWPMTVAMGLCAVLFAALLWSCRHRDRTACFNAFLNNHYAGLILFIGLIIEYSWY